MTRGTIPWALQHLVVPVISQMISESELEGVQVKRRSHSVLVAVISAGGEDFEFYLWEPEPCENESAEEGRERFASQLQDSIAESRFAWGEQREFDERGHRSE